MRRPYTDGTSKWDEGGAVFPSKIQCSQFLRIKALLIMVSTFTLQQNVILNDCIIP